MFAMRVRCFDMNSKTKELTLNAVLAALVIVATLFVRIPTPTGGSVNLGDAAVLIAAFRLGGLRGGLIGGIGSAAADLMGGSAAFALPTLFIKFAEGLVAGIVFKRLGGGPLGLAASSFSGGACMVGGYFAFELFAMGAGPALAVLVPNVIQAIVCGVAASVAFPFVSRSQAGS